MASRIASPDRCDHVSQPVGHLRRAPPGQSRRCVLNGCRSPGAQNQFCGPPCAGGRQVRFRPRLAGRHRRSRPVDTARQPAGDQCRSIASSVTRPVGGCHSYRRDATHVEKAHEPRVPFQRVHTSAFPPVRIARRYGDAMPKSAPLDSASRRHGRPRPAELPNVVEGQIAELCRDLAIEGKRMRQLQEQADELRRVIRQWAGHSEARSDGDMS